MLVDKELFWSKVNIQGPEECWEWQAGKSGDGYGAFCIEGKVYKAHRVSFYLANSYMPDYSKKRVVMHTCDNTKCVNPRHLRDGTVRENMEDKIGKGRAVYGILPHHLGEANSFSKLSETDVREIKRLLKEGVKQKILANMFNTSQTNISSIKIGRTWSNI